MKIKTQAVHFTADQKLIDFIDKKMTKLEQFYDRIQSGEAVLKLENSGQVKDKVAELRLNVPGTTLIAKDTQKTFEAAVDFASESLRRQLMRYKDKTQSRR